MENQADNQKHYDKVVQTCKDGDLNGFQNEVNSMSREERITVLGQFAKACGNDKNGLPMVELSTSEKGNITEVKMHTSDDKGGTVWQEDTIRWAGRKIAESTQAADSAHAANKSVGQQALPGLELK